MIPHLGRTLFCNLVIAVVLSPALFLSGETGSAPTILKINVADVAGHVSPSLYGLMTEEINYSYEGGLYGELIRNRSFKEDATAPLHWQVIAKSEDAGSISLDESDPLNAALQLSLKLVVAKASVQEPVGVANEGYWGIPVKQNTRYHASFYARATRDFKGPVTVAITNNDGTTVHAKGKVTDIGEQWKKYELNLQTGNTAPSSDNHLLISFESPGTVWLSQVSLFPPTWNDRPNGNRRDLMQLLADMKPAFLRFPGGNYLEGNTIATRFDWKKTLGEISRRPGHMNDGWKYWSNDGLGLLEFLEWCEDLHMYPVLAVYAGYSMHQDRVAPGKELETYVQDALDEIEYVSGDPTTAWGARRAKDGHPAPFPLTYVEIGNEDNFDKQAGSYDGRFAQFFDAIKARYPALKVIATTKITSRTPDLIDDHFYRSSMQMQADTSHYDKADRNGPKIFVGEWATREGAPTPNMNAALGDAAWMTGMERNSDLVIMSCYAPLFVNVNPGAMQWKTDLIGYDTLSSYGSPAYYAQKMFSTNHGDVVLVTSAEGIPSREWQPPTPRKRADSPETPVAPPPVQVPSLFFNATRDTKSHIVYLKIVNTVATAQPVRIEINGGTGIEPAGESIVLSAEKPEDTNSITEPAKIVPVVSTVDSLSATFTRTFPPYSITILKLKTK